MASLAKKAKARNSHCYDGQGPVKCKRLSYYDKTQRRAAKKVAG